LIQKQCHGGHIVIAGDENKARAMIRENSLISNSHKYSPIEKTAHDVWLDESCTLCKLLESGIINSFSG
jgi:hypothetical protein